jgi:hypothetical protein
MSSPESVFEGNMLEKDCNGESITVSEQRHAWQPERYCRWIRAIRC